MQEEEEGLVEGKDVPMAEVELQILVMKAVVQKLQLQKAPTNKFVRFTRKGKILFFLFLFNLSLEKACPGQHFLCLAL